MLPPDTIDEIDNYWVSHLGCPPESLFDAHVVVLPHSTFKGYQGLFLVRRGQSCIVTAPVELMDLVHTLVHNRSATEVFGTGLWRQSLPDVIDRIVGPATIMYGDASCLRTVVPEGTRLLGADDRELLHGLRLACGDDEWMRSGILPDHPFIFGHFVDGRLVAAASYEIWADRIAHLGVLTHPAHRGRGYGSAVISAASDHAIHEGLVVQFRTLRENTAALTIARRLGFEDYAETFAIGLNVNRIRDYIEEDRRRREATGEEEESGD